MTGSKPSTPGEPSVTRALRSVAAHGLPSRLGPAAIAGPAWAHFMAMAEHQRLQGLVGEAIQAGALRVSAEQAAQARRATIEAARQVLALEAVLLRALSTLGPAYPVRLLKGPVLARTAYDDVSSRGFIDIDLLLPSTHVDAAVTTLEAAGWRRLTPQLRAGFDRRFGKTVCLEDSDGLQLDLHRTLAKGPYGLLIDVDSLWAGETHVSVAGQQIPCLPAEHHFLAVCYHAALGDVPPRLVPLRDVAQTLLHTDLDADRIAALARSWRGEAVLARALTLAWEILELEQAHPLVEWARAYRPGLVARLDLLPYVSRWRGPALMMLGSLRALPETRARMALVRAMVFPERAFLERRGLSRLRWLWKPSRSSQACVPARPPTCEAPE